MIRTPEEAALDAKKIWYGKHAGMSPDEIAESDPKYIVWGYGNIKDKPFCSYPLAVKCGYVDMSGRDPSARDLPLADRNEGFRDNPYRRRAFDAMDDDDIPY